MRIENREGFCDMSLLLNKLNILRHLNSLNGNEVSIDSSLMLDSFLEYLGEKNLTLYPAQEEAILEIMSGKNVILNTPTGSGKSLVALALHFDSIVRRKRSYYTSPIKALVNEKFFSLCREFGPENVGMITGDSTVNPSAPIICCTAEILSMEALRDGVLASVQDVVMDEFHYYADRERGVAWQVPLICLGKTRMLLMSATLGDPTFFQEKLTQLNKLPTVVVTSQQRPVPLEFSYSESPLHETVDELISKGRAPIYLVSFSQRECANEIQNFMSVDVCTKEEKSKINDELKGFSFSSPYGKELQRFLKHGLGLHHAGLLPKYRVLVEKLAQKGLLKIIFGTDTLGVGVNVPLKTVLLTKLCKFDGNKSTLLSVRDFQQIAGRAGRKGFDQLGTIVAQAPEHIIENKRNEQKAAGDPKKLKKLVKKKPPEKGYVPWSQETLTRLVQSPPESLISRFKISHSMLLHVLSRPQEDGCRAMQKIISQCHESPENKRKIFKKGFELFRSLVDRKIIELNPMRVNVDLQEDFSLNHGLSLFLLDAIRLLDPSSPEFHLEVVTLTESILESPDLIIRKQLDRLKSEKMRELKAQGMEFEERLEELDKLEHPKPMRDFIYNTFNDFSRLHPWIENENIKPKSIAREMFEGFYSFGDYIKEYDLQRAEGILLRYLTDFYKTLTQNVPDFAKTESVFEIEVYFENIIRQVDSSLLDEWEKMKTTDLNIKPHSEKNHLNPVSIEGDKGEKSQWSTKVIMINLRNESFRLLKYLSLNDIEKALEVIQINKNELELKTQLENSLHEYYQSGHSKIILDNKARSTEFVTIRPQDSHQAQIECIPAGSSLWFIEQRLMDPEGHNDWVLELEAIVNPINRTIQLFLIQLRA